MRLVHDRAGARGLVAGIGSVSAGFSGLVATLTAALLARSSGRPGTVLSSGDLGPAQVLLSKYAAGLGFGEAATLLAPLHSEPLLLATLVSYLDHACVVADTARALGVHRNTVMQRIRRIEQLLGVRLDDPDTRLALQLAHRVAGH